MHAKYSHAQRERLRQARTVKHTYKFNHTKPSEHKYSGQHQISTTVFIHLSHTIKCDTVLHRAQ